MKIILASEATSPLAGTLLSALAEEAAEVVWATSQHTLDVDLAKAPDAVVVDAALAWGNPVEVIAAIRTRRARLHLVAVTPSNDPDLSASLLQAGALYCVPVTDIARLHSALRWLQLPAAPELAFFPAPRDTQVAFCVLQLQAPDQWTVVNGNGDVEPIFGVRPDQIVGRSLQDAFPSLAATTLSHLLTEVVLSGQARDLGELRPVADDVQQDYELKAFPMPGQCVGLLCENVTQQKTALDTHMRTEEQMLQTRKMQAVGRLAAGVAHDFNNLMTAIVGYADLILADLPPEHPSRLDIDEILKATERASALTRQLSALNPHQVVAARELDINQLIVDSTDQLAATAGPKTSLDFNLHPGLPPVMTDPARLEQILFNLVTNARDALAVRVSIETREVILDESHTLTLDLSAGRYILLVVSDTGGGMDTETRSRMFEPFFTTKANSQGLGLTTVYGYVRQAHGATEVASEKGRGTTIKIYLPCARIQAAVPETAVGRHEGHVILLAEDEDILSELMGRILRRQGFQVLSARNGNEALTLSKEHKGPIHLLITDVMMPQLGGAELATALHIQRPDTRILFISGYTDSKHIKRGVKLDTVDFLQKPFTPEGFMRKVSDILTRQVSIESS